MSLSHFKDFPNDAGFMDAEETITPVELKVTGQIPSWINGILYRTGPGRYTVDCDNGYKFQIQHWFDGFTLNHRFDINSDGTVIYRSRFATDDVIEKVRKTGKLDGVSFAQRDLCQSTFSKFFTFFKSSLSKSKGPMGPSDSNIGVTISPRFASTETSHRPFVVKTDVNCLQELDLETLEPKRIFSYSTYNSEVIGELAAAHSEIDPESEEIYNYLLKLPNRYDVFGLNPVGKMRVLASVRDAPGAYLHSLFQSQNYIILCIWQADFAMRGIPILLQRNVLDAIKGWDSSRKSLFYVISKRDGIEMKVKAPPFFCFHTVNAYEEGDNIILDSVVYGNHSILKLLFVSRLSSKSATELNSAWQGTIRRHVINRKDKSIREDFTLPSQDMNIELPVINPAYKCRKHRFIYGIHATGASSFVEAIIKVDVESKSAQKWSISYCTPSEPIFVARPNGISEDDGVLLTVVLDGQKRKSMLVLLDAKDLKEIARAEMESAVPFGFHGVYAGRC